MSPFLPHIDNEKEFSFKSNQLFGQSATLQIPTAMDMPTIANNNEFTATNTFEIKTSIKRIQNQKKSYQDKLIIHYKHEKRFRSFKRDLHQIHDAIFKNSPVYYVKLIVGHKNRRSARHELIRKRPKTLILKNVTKKSKPHLRHP